jgi:tetratricopeptide (TPR) repeat protein
MAVPECNWAGAEQAYRRALELAPNDGKTHNWYANLLAAVRRLGEAIEEAKHAVRLDPLNLTWNMGVGHMLYLARQYEEAIDQELRTLEMDEHFALAHWILGLCYEQVGRLSESVEALQQAEQCSGHNPFMRGLLGRACALAGRPGEARAALKVLLAGNESGYVAADAVAVIHAGLGDRDNAFQWLNRAVDFGCYSITFLGVSPLFDALRDDPRFDRLLGRLNLV